MEPNWAAENLQTIRTLMERSALYRRALAPIMTCAGVLGLSGGIVGAAFHFDTPATFVRLWGIVGVAAGACALLLVRRQAIKDKEAFWSPPTRRVAQGMLPPILVGAVAGFLTLACPGWDAIPAWTLPAFWMVLYGCALNTAGFFMTRGIRILGWLFIICGCGWMSARCWAGGPLALTQAHRLMGTVFGGLHLASGVYLYFTEPRRNET